MPVPIPRQLPDCLSSHLFLSATRTASVEFLQVDGFNEIELQVAPKHVYVRLYFLTASGWTQRFTLSSWTIAIMANVPCHFTRIVKLLRS